MNGKTIIVTGASAGIGSATVRLLAQRGANVVLSARRAERLEQLTAELAALPGKRLVVAGDVRDAAYRQRLVDETIASFGRIDVLVNNAGLGHVAPVAELPADHLQTVFDTNVYAPLYLSQLVLPIMQQQQAGQIINVSSIVGQRPLPTTSAYTASKSALNFFTRSLRMELQRSPITVTLVYPGLTNTEFHQGTLGTPRKPLRGNLRGVSAEKVAAAIATAIEQRRQEVYIQPTDWLFTHVNRLFPRLTDTVMPIALRFIGR